MSGLGEKFRLWGAVKHFFKCVKWSRQRITRGFCDRDMWEMFRYLQALLPDMLQYLKDNRQGSPSYLGENYTDEDGILANDTCHGEWDKVLDRMIFLWKESSEHTCSKKNPYEETHRKAFEEFTRRFGLLGEKLQTSEEREETAKYGTRRMHFMGELPEYKEISDRYMEAEKELDAYRKNCKDEALDLLKEHFFSLWD